MQNKEIQDKARDTCRERYGVDNPSKAQEIKTCLLGKVGSLHRTRLSTKRANALRDMNSSGGITAPIHSWESLLM